MPIFFVLFVVLPIIEMYILIQVGSVIGGLYTIGLVLLTALIGASLLKRQGLATFMTAQQKMQNGEMPVKEMAEGLMIAIAGALLLTPGFITDGIGFILLTPVLRQMVAKTVFNAWLKNNQKTQYYHKRTFYSQGSPYQQDSDTVGDRRESSRQSAKETEVIIEGEFQTISEEKIEKK